MCFTLASLRVTFTRYISSYQTIVSVFFFSIFPNYYSTAEGDILVDVK